MGDRSCYYITLIPVLVFILVMVLLALWPPEPYVAARVEYNGWNVSITLVAEDGAVIHVPGEGARLRAEYHGDPCGALEWARGVELEYHGVKVPFSEALPSPEPGYYKLYGGKNIEEVFSKPGFIYGVFTGLLAIPAVCGFIMRR